MARDYNFWIYIITNKHRTVLYIGMTDDLIRRVGEHRAGEIPGFTARYRCKELVYDENCLDAITREKQLKRWSHSKKAALIATLNPYWRDLVSEILGEEQTASAVRLTSRFSTHTHVLFVIPSKVEESLTLTSEKIRDVSTDARHDRRGALAASILRLCSARQLKVGT